MLVMCRLIRVFVDCKGELEWISRGEGAGCRMVERRGKGG